MLGHNKPSLNSPESPSKGMDPAGQPEHPVAVGDGQANQPTVSMDGTKARKWHSLLIALCIILAGSVAVFFLLMSWVSHSAQSGKSGVEFIGLAVITIMAPIIGISALSIIVVGLLYMHRGKPRGKSLMLSVLAILVALYPAFSVVYLAVDQSVQTHQRDKKIAQERAKNTQEEALNKQRILDMSSEITKDEAIALLKSCKVYSLHYGEQYNRDEGLWGESSSTGAVVTRTPGDSKVTISIADRYSDEVVSIAKEAHKSCDATVMLFNDGPNGFAQGI